MTYKVLTDHWKYGLSEGDVFPESMYSPGVLQRASESGYIEPIEEENNERMEEMARQAGEEIDGTGQ